MLLATLVPMLLVLAVQDMAGLADLYAVGVVGAIATNLGATCTDRKAKLNGWERALMSVTFLVMAAIEVSLLIAKPNARYFAFTILAVGLVLRGLVQERRARKENGVLAADVRVPEQAARPSAMAAPCFARCARKGAPWISRCAKRGRPVSGCIFSSCASSVS